MNKIPIFLSIFFLVFFIAMLCIAYIGNVPVYEFYSTKLQSSFFTGFLTLGGFLLSLKTFILIKLKEDLYNNKNYRKRFNRNKLLNPNITLYGPLSRLGTFLIYCVLSALLSSFSQFTVGFISSPISASFCISISAVTVVVVLWAWWEIKGNLIIWFELLEEGEQNQDG